MTKAVEIYDRNSDDFGNLLLCGREFEILAVIEDHYSAGWSNDPYGNGCPTWRVLLSLRELPPPPPPTPKRTWTDAMGLRRPR